MTSTGTESMLKRALANPRRVLEYPAERALVKLGQYVNFGQRPYDFEWDVMVVLDACRYDMFLERARDHPIWNSIESIESIYSCGSATPEWIEKSFSDADPNLIENTVYVTGTGFSPSVAGIFQHTEEVWPYGHDEQIGTVPPDAITNESIRAYRERDAEKYIFHYLQPHAPFIHCPGKYGSMKTKNREGTTQNVWHGVAIGKYSQEEVWKDYCQNLEPGLDHALKIIENVDGKVVITSDHGNLMGHCCVYGHPSYVPVPRLKRVPFAVAEGNGFDTYEVTEVEKETNRVDQDAHLQALGYKI